MKKFSINREAVKDDSDDYGRFISYDLYAEGDTEEELWADATYMMIDQDGGEVGQTEADDKYAIRIVSKFFEELTDEEREKGKREY
jgi:hypothetical protein